ncbi:MAG TPA: hypothetical protein ENN67_08805 [Firmicutes bacterium]|nr:hypothetical protein [Bacillota bacterium]
MLLFWWICTIEIPGHILFRIAQSNWVERSTGLLTLWAFNFTMTLSHYRPHAILVIIALVILHHWLSIRREKWDVYGKWLFRAGFLLLYIILYAIFMLVFLGVEIPVWTWPSEITRIQGVK